MLKLFGTTVLIPLNVGHLAEGVYALCTDNQVMEVLQRPMARLPPSTHV